MCPSSGHELSKEFAPHLWTEFTESIDVVGARKNRIESAQNISDVLEVSIEQSIIIIIIIIITGGDIQHHRPVLFSEMRTYDT